MKDYDGDMDFYQKQLEKKGVTKDMFDISGFRGLSAAIRREPVRCKDCVKSDACKLIYYKMIYYKNENWYCADGEKRKR